MPQLNTWQKIYVNFALTFWKIPVWIYNHRFLKSLCFVTTAGFYHGDERGADDYKLAFILKPISK